MTRSRAKTTVLVVEDDPDLRSLYRAALQLAGFVVLTASDGIEALRHIEAGAPHAVVLDLGLPRLHGQDVQRELADHADTCDIPIVVVTGSDTPHLDPRDFACILRKPVDPAALASAVRKCLGQAG